MKKILMPVFALFMLTAHAQTEVEAYQPGLTAEGITYFLPKTGLHLTVKAKRVAYVPGEYCQYAERYLRLKNVTMSPYETWQITDVTVTPYGVADKQKAYSVKLKTKTSAPLVGLAPDGRLLSVNSEAPELPRLSVASVGEKVSSRVAGSDFKTEEILLAGSTAKMAELAAEEIFDIRDNRGLLAKGQADFMPKDGEQLRLMLESLDKQEKALLQLFKGYTTTEEHVFTFDYVPAGEVKNDLIFRFSTHLGMVDADDLAGAPVTITVKDLQSLPPVMTDGKKKKEVEGLRYMLPGRAGIKVFWDGKEVAAATLPMAQFGRLENLGGDLFNKKYTTRVVLSPETGGIVKIDADEPE